jgi:Flp pilus assembly pilin Flp
MKKLLRRFYDDETGVSAVEFALIAAFVLVPLLLGGSELGYRTWAKHQFEDAAQAGMDYAIVQLCIDGACGQITAAAVQGAVQTATKLTNITVAPAPWPRGVGDRRIIADSAHMQRALERYRRGARPPDPMPDVSLPDFAMGVAIQPEKQQGGGGGGGGGGGDAGGGGGGAAPAHY